jgi:uncharacterized protein (DUF58 family)
MSDEDGEAGSSDVAARKKEWMPQILEKMRAPRSLRFTREGKFFIGIALGVGFAAINTGNNLLYLLLGLLLALIVVSGIMSELSLRGLAVKRKLPQRAQVAKPHVVEVEVFNHKSKMPSYAIEVEDLRAGLPADKRCFFLKISPQSAQVAAYRRTPTKRGRDKHTGFRIATRFPFGLFEKSKVVHLEGELVIFPRIDPVQLAPNLRGRGLGSAASQKAGAGDDLIGLRLKREGDDERDIYWKKSASQGQLVLRERAVDIHPEQTLVLELSTADSPAALEAFERRIRETASAAVAHIKRGEKVVLLAQSSGHAASGHAAKVASTEQPHQARVMSTPQSGADGLLRFLALVEPRLVKSVLGAKP